ncbi:MAG: Phage integrase [uncultured Campylobacterales bacterium]|uniref:Phage integrase n=1 Tax=uncultured Campylobacterales bacterium TaxID=352960 RepID=A0A6S6RXD1_9BACT|nr:MAG: Phage integrase [uncultured Campylobacterales bacterium]
MALNIIDYENVKGVSNLKIHKTNHTKFIFDFRFENKRYRKSYKVKATNWTKRDCIREATKKLQAYKNDIEVGQVSTSFTTLDKMFSLYVGTLDPRKEWTNKKQSIYKLYIKDVIGNKQIDKIREMDIERALVAMKRQGLKPRTQKSVLEVLKPLFSFAIKNKYLKENPSEGIVVNIPSQKRLVTDATELFTKVYKGIISYYKNDPFYRALFLFACLDARRKSEILNLKWENIDFSNNYYWIEDTKNDDKQKYNLQEDIKEALLQIEDEHIGLVFKSPITSKALTTTDRQMRQLKKYIGIDNLSMHYMRNIFVSMGAENKIEAITLSGALGHKDANTINKYLSTNHYNASLLTSKTIQKVLN